jgi:FkbM family methyltransferase
LEWEPFRLFVERLYFIYKRYLEAPGFGAARHCVASGTWVIDVGANIGYFTSMAAGWVDGKARVIAIEPEPGNLERLNKWLVRRNIQENVDVISAAASDRNGKCNLVVNETHPGDNRLGEDGEEVLAITLDSLMKKRSGATFSLIKLDTQGAEMSVLKGAKRLLERDHPALLVEIDDVALRQFGASADEVIQYLTKIGYAPHRLERTGISSVPEAEWPGIGKKIYQDVLFLWAESDRGKSSSC